MGIGNQAETFFFSLAVINGYIKGDDLVGRYSQGQGRCLGVFEGM